MDIFHLISQGGRCIFHGWRMGYPVWFYCQGQIFYKWVFIRIWIIHKCGGKLGKQTKFTNPTMHLSHIPRCTIQFRTEMLAFHCGMWDRWIVGFVKLSYQSSISRNGRTHSFGMGALSWWELHWLLNWPPLVSWSHRKPFEDRVPQMYSSVLTRMRGHRCGMYSNCRQAVCAYR